MTRFARASGSKASNARVPEEATSWSEMKQQMEASKFRSHRENGDSSHRKTVSNSNVTRFKPIVKHREKVWEEFDDQDVVPHSSITKISGNKSEKTFSTMTGKSDMIKTSYDDDNITDNIRTSENNVFNLDVTHVKPIVRQNENVWEDFDNKNVLSHSPNATISIGKPDRNCSVSVTGKSDMNRTSFKASSKGNNIKSFCKSTWVIESQNINNPCNEVDETVNDNEVLMKNKIKKHKKEYNGTSKNTPISSETIDMKTEVKHVHEEEVVDQSRKRNNESSLYLTAELINNKKIRCNGFIGLTNPSGFDKSLPGSKNSSIDVALFQGFEVKKKDADRLHQLGKDLKAQGIPRKTVLATLHSERRKAEKILARDKKVVCYKCRQLGHTLSDCPDLGDQSDICFKCGSTEHTSKTCRAVKNDVFKHTHCFICQEQGHIARQCPDNPRGLYPKGGSCKICGDVTHLRSDCPDLVDEKEKKKITLGTLNNKSIEGLDEEFIGTKTNTVKKFGVIKF